MLKGGIVTLKPDSGSVSNVIELQYNPHTVQRTLTPQRWEHTTGDRTDALRLKGPAQEVIRMEVEFDARDAWEPESTSAGQMAVRFGLLPQLSVVETLLSPTADALKATHALAAQGILEISPA